MDLTGMLQAAAGASTGNPNAWDISYAVYDATPDQGDLSKAFYTDLSLDMSAQSLGPSGFYIKPDGLSLYMCTSGTVFQYTLVTPWVVTGGSYASKSVAVNTVADATALFFKDDGTKMFVLGQLSGLKIQAVYQYSLSTAWDVSTATYDSVSFSLISQDATPRGLFFKPDGTKMYVVGATNDKVYEYSLSTAWSISSASYVQDFSISAQETTPSGISFLEDGATMYISGQAGDDINEYALSTPWDISTASYTQNFSVASQTVNPVDLFFKPDGSMLFVLAERDGGNNQINKALQYTFGGFSVATQETSPQGIFFKPDGTKMYIVGLTGDAVYEYNLSTDWDITTASYLQNFSVSSQEANPSDLFFKDDGTKMYIIGFAGDDVNEYSLSVAWDISSASYTTNFSVASQELGPNALFFKPDGTKMYIVGQGNDTIYQYGLSTAWDISSASYDSVSFSIAAQDGTPNGLSFKPDGTKMYVLGNTGDDVNEYNLSSAWDLSTATFVQNTGVLETSPSGLFWRDNGEEFFIVGGANDRVLKYIIPSE